MQFQDDVTPLVVQKPVIQARKRKGIFSFVDHGELPSHRGPKKQKFGKTPQPKVSKFPPMTVDLDDLTVNLVPIQTTPFVQPENLPPPAAKAPHRTHPSKPTKCFPNLVLDEGYSWWSFKGLITEHEVNACYNMLVKDFKRSAIHDLFKVSSFSLSLFYFLRNLSKISNSPSSVYFSCHVEVLHWVHSSQGAL